MLGGSCNLLGSEKLLEIFGSGSGETSMLSLVLGELELEENGSRKSSQEASAVMQM